MTTDCSAKEFLSSWIANQRLLLESYPGNCTSAGAPSNEAFCSSQEKHSAISAKQFSSSVLRPSSLPIPRNRSRRFPSISAITVLALSRAPSSAPVAHRPQNSGPTSSATSSRVNRKPLLRPRRSSEMSQSVPSCRILSLLEGCFSVFALIDSSMCWGSRQQKKPIRSDSSPSL